MVTAPIVLIADHIESRGICDNKKVKPQEQNAYYQTLAQQKRERERVMQLLAEQKQHIQTVDQADSSSKKMGAVGVLKMFDVSIES